jgi:hypothetical protein
VGSVSQLERTCACSKKMASIGLAHRTARERERDRGRELAGGIG